MFVYQIGTIRVEMYMPVFKDRWSVSYRMYDTDFNSKPIFEGSDYYPSPMFPAVLSEESALGLLGFLALNEGDIEKDYFQGYTARQMRWRDTKAADVMAEVLDREEAISKAAA